jgi:hypothetical protein
LQVYPNPGFGTVNLKANEQVQLHLVNQLGQELESVFLSAENNYEGQLHNLTAGIYLVYGDVKTGRVQQKIVVSR